MADIGDSLQVSDRELAAGFVEQTLSYPDRYELPKLGKGRSRLERAVALVVDGSNRVKRAKSGEGYVHEVLADGEWQAGDRFTSLDEVLASDVYGIFARSQPGTEGPVEETDS